VKSDVESDMNLLANSDPAPMNPFVKNLLRSTAEGFISSLKRVNINRRK